MNILLVKLLLSNQQQITEQARFTDSPLGKPFEKQIKAIEDQGKKQVEALENLKPKEETKPTEDESGNKSKATTIFNKLLNERKKTMNELYKSVDYNNLEVLYVGPTKDVSFYEYKNPK